MIFGSLAIIMPSETPVCEDEKIDWVGSVLGIAGLISFNFVFKYVFSTVPPSLRLLP
jgi:hypothetical protein